MHKPKLGVEYEDLSPEAKTLFDETKPIARTQRKELKEKGYDLFKVMTQGITEDELLDMLLDMQFPDDPRLDNLEFYEERAIMAEILTKSINKVGQRERKN